MLNITLSFKEAERRREHIYYVKLIYNFWFFSFVATVSSNHLVSFIHLSTALFPPTLSVLLWEILLHIIGQHIIVTEFYTDCIISIDLSSSSLILFSTNSNLLLNPWWIFYFSDCTFQLQLLHLVLLYIVLISLSIFSILWYIVIILYFFNHGLLSSLNIFSSLNKYSIL